MKLKASENLYQKEWEAIEDEKSVKETLKAMMSKMSSDEKITGVKTTGLILAQAVMAEAVKEKREADG